MMRASWYRLFTSCGATLAAGTLLLFSGCDEQTRTTVEDGVIDVSSSLFGAFLQAIIQLATESAATTGMIVLGV